MLHAPKDCRPHQVARGPLMPFLEQHGSCFLSAHAEGHSGHAPRLGFSPSNWYGLLNLSAYKALHPAWDQERDLLHLAEGLEEHCQEGTLEYWWRPEIQQWLVSHKFDVALIQEHRLSETAFHAESVALSKACDPLSLAFAQFSATTLTS